MSRPSVLVVDDDDLVRDTLVAFIKICGCDAVGAENGLRALELLLTGDFCLIFLDLVMPVLDGSAFREEQLKREEIAGIPVALMSAFGDLEDRSKQMQVEVYLQKPIGDAEVIDVVKRYCRCEHATA
jgi:CheY-like chemotaxis protein